MIDVNSLSDAEIKTRLEQFRSSGVLTKNQPTARQNSRELLAAHQQVLDALTGRPADPDDMSPLARRLLRDGGAPSLIDLARSACQQAYGPSAANWGARDVLATGGPGSDHLGELLSGLASRLLLERQPALLAPALATSRPVELNNFQPASVGTVELSEPIGTATTGSRPWQTLMPSGKVEDMALRSSPVRLRFSEILLVNDDINAVQGIVDAASIGAAQNELEAWASLMNADVTLADGSPAFHADYGNALSTTKDATGLTAAVGLLRSQTVNGKAADCRPRYVVVPGADELTAGKLVRDAFGDQGPVEVVATAYLSSSWYIFSDPATWPVLVRGTLRGTGGVSLRFSRDNPGDKEGSRDLILSGLHSYDYAVSSRVGAVRMTF